MKRPQIAAFFVLTDFGNYGQHLMIWIETYEVFKTS